LRQDSRINQPPSLLGEYAQADALPLKARIMGKKSTAGRGSAPATNNF